MSKIHMEELSELLKGGKTQRACAKHFGVSEVAVCKAVKRLKAQVPSMAMQSLTAKERVFLLNVASGKSPTEAALLAYDCSTDDVAKTLGSRMIRDPDVKTCLSEIMAQEGIPRRRRIQRLRDLIESKDLTAVSRGLDQSWKLEGSYSPVQLDFTVNYDPAAQRERIAELRQLLKDFEALKGLPGAPAYDAENVIDV